MSTDHSQTKSRFRLSLDGWAVLIAFALALAVKLGILKSIPW